MNIHLIPQILLSNSALKFYGDINVIQSVHFSHHLKFYILSETFNLQSLGCCRFSQKVMLSARDLRDVSPTPLQTQSSVLPPPRERYPLLFNYCI